MNNSAEILPTVYLSVLLIILGAIAVFVLLQIVKTQRRETNFAKLQKKLKDGQGTAQDYYELGGLYLDKKLFVQSTSLFEKGLKLSKVEPENQALIYNALGYSYFAQEQYDLAIRNYKEALKLYPEYTIALNNLGNAYEKKQLIAQALEIYEQTLGHQPENKVAQRRVESLRKRIVPTQPNKF
ncbi:tetratricopeptide repeat protein [Gloeocapsa sp. PCC 73106]|uniref:tetratricopeptide repeat protein n=1 Tax=Gloeocapsa sp. PCC 73106 TaxID=102232 RepID=UPI0002ACF620|nr:tetratricopeptide repeat protein [Gloeocapsa sp. PCC 73106]ELR97203.1 tetratricopeptide repeat protein [Gloeocapsa sp. PCC 73106]